MKNKISFVGGDLRMIEAARYSLKAYQEADIFGFDKYDYCYSCFGIKPSSNLKECLSDTSAVVLGLPASFDGEKIFAPFCLKEIKINDLLKIIPSDALLFGGRIPEKLKNLAGEYGINCFDYFDREELTIKNALITAEGALSVAMTETAHTIHSSKCLVIGYGRIGKLLSGILHNLGAKVTCSARKESDLALVECAGLTPVYTSDITKNISEYDIIFNTVPVCILSEDILSCIREDTLIIDLASKPGGLDFASARKLGLKVVWATSLPGKVAPITSGKIIFDTILNIINENKGR